MHEVTITGEKMKQNEKSRATERKDWRRRVNVRQNTQVYDILTKFGICCIFDSGIFFQWFGGGKVCEVFQCIRCTR